MPQVRYTVECIDGAWQVTLNGRHFGPYSVLETAVAAATRAAHKAEAQGYEAVVNIITREAETPAAEPEAPSEPNGDRNAA
jgi:hypothetical protein